MIDLQQLSSAGKQLHQTAKDIERIAAGANGVKDALNSIVNQPPPPNSLSGGFARQSSPHQQQVSRKSGNAVYNIHSSLAGQLAAGITVVKPPPGRQLDSVIRLNRLNSLAEHGGSGDLELLKELCTNAAAIRRQLEELCMTIEQNRPGSDNVITV